MRSILSLALIALALPSLASDLWVEAKRSTKSIAIPSVAPLVERAMPAVLVVQTEGGVAPELPPGHPAMPDGAPQVRGQGSGYIIHPSGLALTNFHVIEAASRIQVRAGTSSELIDATVIGSDEKTDVALLQLAGNRHDWPTVPLGKSASLRVGDFVVAIGNPYGLANSISVGVISGRARHEVNPSGRMGLYDFLQTDASINLGNSGGPLLNLRGEVVGMNTAINAAAQGIGFAIPVDQIKKMLPALKKDGRIIRSWIGVGIGNVDNALAKSVGLRAPEGALIVRVLPDGPGAKAGLTPGDIVLRFDGSDIQNSAELPLIAGDAGVGHTADLLILRNRGQLHLKVTLGLHPDSAKKKAKVVAKAAPKEVGLSVVTLNSDDKKKLHIDKKQRGLRVVVVKPGSAASVAGLMEDDVITKANGEEVALADAFADVVKATKSGEIIRLFVLRRGSSLFVALQKP